MIRPIRNSSLLLLWLGWWLTLNLCGAETVKGKVINEEGLPVPMAFIMLEGCATGRSVETDGSFELYDLDPARSNFLLISCQDYRSLRVPIVFGRFLQVTLQRMFTYDVSVVAESSISSEAQKGAVITKMDTYSIPGTAADPVLSAMVLPGIASHPDTSDLLVRGGAPDEIGYYYDGFEIFHPFQMESSQANYFSVFDNQIIDRFNVVNSGFEPRFGNCLSGVLDIRSNDQIFRNRGGLGLSLMGASGYYETPIGSKWGVILTGKKDFSEVLGRLNGFGDINFDNLNQMGNLVFDSGVNTKLKLSWLYNSYSYNQRNEFVSNSGNFFVGLSLQTLWRNALLSKISAAYIDYTNCFSIPSTAFSKEFRDIVPQIRIDNVLDLALADLEFGMDFVWRRETVEIKDIVEPFQVSGSRWGFYLNAQFPVLSGLLAETGVRANVLGLSGTSQASLDPRASLAWTLGAHHVFRISTGLYSQFGDLFDHAQHPLKPRRAMHVSLTYDFMADKTHARFSLFSKEYAQLFLKEPTGRITNNGKGYARGFELYLVHETGPFKIIGLYNYLKSKRREGDILNWADSSYAAPHSGLLVVSARFKILQVSMRGSYSAGLPYTPLSGSVFDDEAGVFVPDYGEVNGDRLPHFFRLDVNLSKNVLIGKQMVAFYCGVINLTNRINVQDMSFNEHSGLLEPNRSIFKRSFFLGFYVPFE